MRVPLTFADRAVDVDSQLLVELTKRCHCACAHCYTDAGPDVRTPEPSPRELETLLTSARRLGLQSVTLTGGEVMLRHDIDDIIEAVPPDVELWLFTSGIHLDDERLARWRTRVCGYVVSLDGTSTRHDWLRRRATSFDENSAFLRRLAKASCRVQLQSMVLRPDDEHLEPIVELAEAIGAERVLFSHVSPDGRGRALVGYHMDPAALDRLQARVARLQQDTAVRLLTNLMPTRIVAARFPPAALHVLPSGEVLPWFGAPRRLAVARLDASGWDLAEAVSRSPWPDRVSAAFARARASALEYEGAAVPVDDLLVCQFAQVQCS